jgi:YHS domain-containing protein
MKQLAALLVACCLSLCVSGAFGADAKKPDEKKKPVNQNCPVTGEKVDPTVQTVQYKGKTVGFCCPDCIKDFNKDTAKYGKVVDDELAKQKKEGKKDDKPKGEQPAAAVNKLCPVEHENAVDPTAPTTVYKGKTIGFCCDDCIKKFESNPDSFAANLK